MTQMMLGPVFAAEAGLTGQVCNDKLTAASGAIKNIQTKLNEQAAEWDTRHQAAIAAQDQANADLFWKYGHNCRVTHSQTDPIFNQALASHREACAAASSADTSNTAAAAAAARATAAMTGKADSNAQVAASNDQSAAHSRAMASLAAASAAMNKYDSERTKAIDIVKVYCPEVAQKIASEEAKAAELSEEAKRKIAADQGGTAGEGISTGTAIVGGLAIAGLAGLGGYALGGGFKKDKGGGGGGGSSPSTPVTSTPTTPTPPPALTGPGETPEGLQNLTASETKKTMANAGTPQNLTPVTSGTEENQGAQGRSGSALSSGASGSGAGSGAGSGGGGSSAGAQGRMANARSASTGGGGSGFSPSSFGGGGGGGDGKELKDGAAVGYAAALKGCQPKVAKQMRDSRTKKMLTVMIDNPNYKQCKPLEAKSKVRTPASSKRAAKIKTDALLN